MRSKTTGNYNAKLNFIKPRKLNDTPNVLEFQL